MAFSVNLYSFSKKINSTARPGEADKTYSCVMKEPCTIINPIIGLDIGLTTSPSTYNYAYMPIFDRYYFIKDWNFDSGIWYAHLEVDVLASWKNTIGASTCYVLRSSMTYNLDIQDTTYPATNKTTTVEDIKDSWWSIGSISEGMFVVGIAGQSTTYYLFLKDALDAFFDYLFSDLYANGLVGDWSTLFPQLKAQANPIQYITSILWIPFRTVGTEVSTIRVGWVNVPVAAWRVDGSGIRSGVDNFTLQAHPQASRGRYLNNRPYTTYTLFYPPWGTVPLDSDLLSNSSKLGVIWNVDLRTGRGTLTITDDNGHILSWLQSQVGLNYQVSQVLNSGFGIGNVLAPLISSTAAAASGNFAAAAGSAISGGVGAIGDLAGSKIPSATTIGSAGGIDALRGKPTLQYEFKEIVDEDLDHRGRPLCENRQISDLQGYIIVADADIKTPSTRQEQETIRSFMEGGFFYE